MVCFLHPTANENVRAVAKGFAEAGILDKFYTGIAAFPGDWLYSLSSFKPLHEIRRRSFDPELQKYTKQFPWKESARLISERINLPFLTKHEKGIFCIDNIYKNLDRKVSRNLGKRYRTGLSGVYSYGDGSLFSFLEAKKYGLKCYYDLTTGYWRAANKIFAEEAEKWPDWRLTMVGLNDSAQKLLRKDQELSLSDVVFVASSFTRSTLNLFPGKIPNIEVVPYGFPSVSGKIITSSKSRKGSIKVLFVGKLSQQKGLATLLEAVKDFENKIELTIVGRKPLEYCNALNKALSKHKWIPSLSHENILELMRIQDLLIFPTIFDGFGMVMTEAMSQGTPVIATERSAAPDIIEHGENGWIVEASSVQALKNQIETILLNSGEIKRISQNAIETARQRTWEVYGREMAESIIKHQKEFA